MLVTVIIDSIEFREAELTKVIQIVTSLTALCNRFQTDTATSKYPQLECFVNMPEHYHPAENTPLCLELSQFELTHSFVAILGAWGLQDS